MHAGDDLRWASPGFDDSSWSEVALPSILRQGPSFFWLRRTAHAPDCGGDCWLTLGLFAESYEVYFNGQIIGQTEDFHSPNARYMQPLAFRIGVPLPPGQPVALAFRALPPTVLGQNGPGYCRQGPLLDYRESARARRHPEECMSWFLWDRLRLALSRRKLRRELRMLGHCQTLPHQSVDALQIEIPESLDVQTQPWETGGTENSIGSRLHCLKSLRRQPEPDQPPRAGKRDDILKNAHSLVQPLLGPEIARIAGHGDFNNQFGSPGMIRARHPRLSAMLRLCLCTGW